MIAIILIFLIALIYIAHYNQMLNALWRHMEQMRGEHRRSFQTPWTDVSSPFSKDLVALQKRVLDPTMYQRDKYNLVLIGKQHVGKSSFLNSLLTATEPWTDSSDHRVQIPAPTGNAADSFTSIMKRYTVGQYVVAHDMPGLDNNGNLFCDSPKVSDIIMDIIAGKVPDKADLSCPDEVLEEGNPDWRIDAVVIVIDAPSFMIRPDPGLISKYSDLLTKCRAMGTSYTIVLTNVAGICPETKRDIRNVFYSKEIHSAVESVHQKLGVDMRCVVPVENYSTEHNRKEDMDKLQLHCLDIILSRVEEMARFQPDVKYRHHQPDNKPDNTDSKPHKSDKKPHKSDKKTDNPDKKNHQNIF